MEQRDNLEDRRKYIRYYPDKDYSLKTYFIFCDGRKIPINTINISRGGMMGFNAYIEHFLKINEQNIDLIEIHFPDKKPIQSSGRILRLQPGISTNNCFCAVEFNDMKTSNEPKRIDASLESNSPQSTPSNKTVEWRFIHRVKQLDNYVNIENNKQQLELSLRRKAYDSFDDITEHLTIEEKWLFFELLDEMMRYKTDYPEELKQAFVRLCQIGIKAFSDENLIEQQTLSPHQIMANQRF